MMDAEYVIMLIIGILAGTVLGVVFWCNATTPAQIPMLDNDLYLVDESTMIVEGCPPKSVGFSDVVVLKSGYGKIYVRALDGFKPLTNHNVKWAIVRVALYQVTLVYYW